MLQRVFAAYQQITRSINRPAAPRRSASLSVMVLEERATPAVAIMPPPLQPQPMLIIAIPTAPTAAPVVASADAVRSDLFGVGDAGTANQPDDLEAMLASNEAARQIVVDAPAVQKTSATDAGDEVDGGAVIVENMVYLPRVE